MPAKTMGLRLNNWFMHPADGGAINYHVFPEVMLGLSKKVMVHIDGIFSDRQGKLAPEGAGVYLKYRFLSIDNMHRHYRMAAFGRLTTNNSDVHQEELATYGHNSGLQLGLIGTQLLHKVAISGTGYYERIVNTERPKEGTLAMPIDAVTYSLSVGKLMLPKSYASYRQTNLNLMVELLGQKAMSADKGYLDIAPSVQLIFNSQTRIDIGYRKQLWTNMIRTAPNGLLVRVEHIVFNVMR